MKTRQSGWSRQSAHSFSHSALLPLINVAIYVNNVSVPREPDAIKRIVGQALGEIAGAAYDAQ